MTKTIHRIPNRLRRCREDHGISQREVARLLGISNTSMISRWEKGRCLPSSINLFRLAAVYSTMVDELYYEFRVSIRRELMGPDQPPSIRPYQQ